MKQRVDIIMAHAYVNLQELSHACIYHLYRDRIGWRTNVYANGNVAETIEECIRVRNSGEYSGHAVYSTTSDSINSMSFYKENKLSKSLCPRSFYIYQSVHQIRVGPGAILVWLLAAEHEAQAGEQIYYCQVECCKQRCIV